MYANPVIFLIFWVPICLDKVGMVSRPYTMLCPFKVNSYIIELIVQTSCYCVFDLLCVKMLRGGTMLPSLSWELGSFSCLSCSKVGL